MHALIAVASFILVAGSRVRSPEPLMLKKLSPVVNVPAIEPVLPFWTERLGFTVTVQVPDGDRLGFAILEKDGVEIMYQTTRSIEADVPVLRDSGRGHAWYIEVEDVEAVARALEGVEVVVPMRNTFYGAREFFVRAPCGTIAGFAQMSQPEG